MRWKFLEVLGKVNSKNIESYGFTSGKCPLLVQETTDY